jgi:hypothetical protein
MYSEGNRNTTFPEKQQHFEAIRTSANTVPDRVIDLVKYM